MTRFVTGNELDSGSKARHEGLFGAKITQEVLAGVRQHPLDHQMIYRHTSCQQWRAVRIPAQQIRYAIQLGEHLLITPGQPLTHDVQRVGITDANARYLAKETIKKDVMARLIGDLCRQEDAIFVAFHRWHERR